MFHILGATLCAHLSYDSYSYDSCNMALFEVDTVLVEISCTLKSETVEAVTVVLFFQFENSN